MLRLASLGASFLVDSDFFPLSGFCVGGFTLDPRVTGRSLSLDLDFAGTPSFVFESALAPYAHAVRLADMADDTTLRVGSGTMSIGALRMPDFFFGVPTNRLANEFKTRHLFGQGVIGAGPRSRLASEVLIGVDYSENGAIFFRPYADGIPPEFVSETVLGDIDEWAISGVNVGLNPTEELIQLRLTIRPDSKQLVLPETLMRDYLVRVAELGLARFVQLRAVAEEEWVVLVAIDAEGEEIGGAQLSQGLELIVKLPEFEFTVGWDSLRYSEINERESSLVVELYGVRWRATKLMFRGSLDDEILAGEPLLGKFGQVIFDGQNRLIHFGQHTTAAAPISYSPMVTESLSADLRDDGNLVLQVTRLAPIRHSVGFGLFDDFPVELVDDKFQPFWDTIRGERLVLLFPSAIISDTGDRLSHTFTFFEMGRVLDVLPRIGEPCHHAFQLPGVWQSTEVLFTDEPAVWRGGFSGLKLHLWPAASQQAPNAFIVHIRRFRNHVVQLIFTQARPRASRFGFADLELPPTSFRRRSSVTSTSVLSMDSFDDAATDREMVSPTENCPVCIMPLGDDQDELELPCRHCFHLNCFVRWADLGNDSCPTCRHQVGRRAS